MSIRTEMIDKCGTLGAVNRGNARDNESETAAGRAVTRVVGGSYELHDTGTEPGQYDVKVTTADERDIALEVTSVGGDQWRRTTARIEAARRRGHLEGDDLGWQWWVIVASGADIRELEPRLDAMLASLEREGHQAVSARYVGGDAVLTEAAAAFEELRVRSAVVFDDTPGEGEPRVLVGQSDSGIGTTGALPAAIGTVFAKGDNQEKLAATDCDERHLYVVVEDGRASAVLEGLWPLPACPPDPFGVIDVLWLYSPSLSAYLFRVVPGAAKWERFDAVSGEPRS